MLFGFSFFFFILIQRLIGGEFIGFKRYKMRKRGQKGNPKEHFCKYCRNNNWYKHGGEIICRYCGHVDGYY